MGKVTYRRVARVFKRGYVVATLPVIGGVLFAVGSCFFWPCLAGCSKEEVGEESAEELDVSEGHREVEEKLRMIEALGALCFFVGSACYFLAPILDYIELNNASNLLEAPSASGATLSPDQTKMHYEHLYKTHLLRMQRMNCVIYILGGCFFLGGSVLFFPAMEELIMHGGWLYITGCVLTLLGAALATVTANEMKRTANPTHFEIELGWFMPKLLALHWFTDEEATMLSCSLYILGNLLFIVGSVFFFPRILAAGGIVIRYLAVVLFILGSLLFTSGAFIDLLLVVRTGLGRCSVKPARLEEEPRDSTRDSARDSGTESAAASEQSPTDAQRSRRQRSDDPRRFMCGSRTSSSKVAEISEISAEIAENGGQTRSVVGGSPAGVSQSEIELLPATPDTASPGDSRC